MSFTERERERRTAVCTNSEHCTKAQGGEKLEWYQGAGEYCPECGEALTPVEPAAPPPPASTAPPERELARTRPQPRQPAPVPKTDRRRAARAPGGRSGARRWLWLIFAIFIASLAIGFAMQRHGVVGRASSSATIVVCSVPIAKQLASDIVLGYSVKSRTPENRFSLSNERDCDVRFSTAAETPDAVIASDGIVPIVNPLNPVSRLSESDVRGIYSGSIRDWSKLGGQPGTIVPILPDASTAESKVLASSLFYNVTLDRRVLRAATSAEVTRAVTGASRDSRAAIGLVTFGGAVPAKVIPLSYLPAPSVVSIASHRYPYTMTIAINAEAARSDPAVIGLIDYAKSNYGAAIVQATGFIPREGF